MSEKVPFIKDGVLNAHYDLTTSKEAVQSYLEVDLGELNYVNTRTTFFKDPTEIVIPGSYSNLEKKTWDYHIQEAITLPVLPILEELGIKGYNKIEEVIKGYETLFPPLLKEGYYLQGTNVANLFRSIIPSIDHTDFDFFFAAKLYYVSRNLSLIDPFLEFQLQRFQNASKSVIDYKRFLKLSLKEYTNYFKLRKEAVETVEEWITELETNELKGVTSHSDGIKWTGSKVDLIKFVYASFKLNYINNGNGSVTELTGNILQYFGLHFKQNDNTLSNNINQKQNWGGHPEDIFDKLKDSFNEYLRDPHCFKRK